jgi:hypothetical protein
MEDVDILLLEIKPFDFIPGGACVCVSYCYLVSVLPRKFTPGHLDVLPGTRVFNDCASGSR